MEGLAAATLASLMVVEESRAAEPAVEERQLLWPLKLNDRVRAMTALANSVNSLMTACRTASSPGMMPSTRNAAPNTHSAAIKAPQASTQKRWPTVHIIHARS